MNQLENQENLMSTVTRMRKVLEDVREYLYGVVVDEPARCHEAEARLLYRDVFEVLADLKLGG